MTLQCIQPKIIEDTHKPQGCKHKEGGAGATLGCEIGHARVPAAAKGYGEGSPNWRCGKEKRGIVGDKTYMPVLQAECKWNGIPKQNYFPKNHRHV